MTLVYLVTYDSRKVSLEHHLLSWYPSQSHLILMLSSRTIRARAAGGRCPQPRRSRRAPRSCWSATPLNLRICILHVCFWIEQWNVEGVGCGFGG